MKDNENRRATNLGAMRKSREPMADGRRYIIYYTFEKSAESINKVHNGGNSNASTLSGGMNSPMFEKTDDLKPTTEERENV